MGKKAVYASPALLRVKGRQIIRRTVVDEGITRGKAVHTINKI
jgi:hypothetical protein